MKKKMKVLENGKILYKLNRERVEERIKESEFGNWKNFNLAIGRSHDYVQAIFRNRDGYCKMELIEFVAKQLKLPDPDWLIEEGEEDPVPTSDLEEIKNSLKEIKEILTNDDLTIKLEFKPNTKVYYLERGYILKEGIICGYFISNKLNVTYKVYNAVDNIRVDVKQHDLYLNLKEAQNKKEVQ